MEGSGHHPPMESHEGMLPVVESVDVSQRDDVSLLHGGAVGLWGVLFLCVTGAAPISAMLFNTPLSVGYGNGVGTPAGFMFATVILTIFSVGYVAMARKVTAAGGFYSFISHGLGRELGMAAGLAMVVAYSVFEASLCGGFAYFACAKLEQYGYTVSWYWPALFMVALIGILAFFDVKISARVLGVALIGEVLVLTIFDVLVFGQGGENIQAAALNPVNAFKNLPVRQPRRHRHRRRRVGGRRVLRLLVVGRLRDGAELRRGVQRTPRRSSPGHVRLGRRPGNLLRHHLLGRALRLRLDGRRRRAGRERRRRGSSSIPAQQFGNEFLRSVMSYLIITGAFACGMAFHNTTARYFYSLGREKVLPSALGRTHVRSTAARTSRRTTQSVICALIVLAFAVFARRRGRRHDHASPTSSSTG